MSQSTLFLILLYLFSIECSSLFTDSAERARNEPTGSNKSHYASSATSSGRSASALSDLDEPLGSAGKTYIHILYGTKYHYPQLGLK